MNAEEIKKRTKGFALRVLHFCDALTDSSTSRIVRAQLLRSGTSVGANYRAACRARSRADFVHKMGIVEEEVDESMYWMELLVETGLVDESLISDLYREADEILSIVVASIKTARGRTR